MAAAAEVLGEGVRFFASHGKSFSLPDRLGILGGSLFVILHFGLLSCICSI
jgi:hypothetical protein